MRKILILADNDFEDTELIYPYYRFQEAGFKVIIVGYEANVTYKGKYGIQITSNVSPINVNVDEYDAIIIPGGRAPDHMRMNERLVKLVGEAFRKGKVIAAVCHGPQLLIEADILRGMKATCYKSVSTDVKNAGGMYIDKPVVVDRNLVTSRGPADLPDFCREILKLLQNA